MTPRFKNFIPFILKWETEYNKDGSVKVERDPDDKGGTTKYGIDQRSHPEVDIAELTQAQAEKIYWQDYWAKTKSDLLPKGVGEICMNIAVNSGYSRAARWLQQAIGATVDEKIGPKTIERANEQDAAKLAETLLDRHEAHYRSIAKGKQAKYLKGWLNRNNALRKWVASNS